MKSEEFPQEVREGSCVVTIYFTPKHGRPFYTVSYYAKGVRKRAVLAGLEAVRKKAKSMIQKLARGDLNVVAPGPRSVHLF